MLKIEYVREVEAVLWPRGCFINCEVLERGNWVINLGK